MSVASATTRIRTDPDNPLTHERREDTVVPLHRLTRIVLGVPNVEDTAAYYTEFGRTPAATDISSTYGAEAPAPTPPSFLAPEDLAALMTGAHQGQ